MKKKTNCGCIVFKCCIDTLCHVSITLPMYRKGMKGPVINYYSVSQIILSIVLSLTKRPNLLPSLSIVFLDNGVVQLFLVQCCPHAFLCDLCWTIWTIPPRNTQDDAWPFLI